MKFLCDIMLGKLAKYLRILGFDAVYLRDANLFHHYNKKEDPRWLLTRRKTMLADQRTIFIKAQNVREQLKELADLIKPAIDLDKVLTRCINCNVPLVDVKKEMIEHRVPEFVFHRYDLFKICPRCERVYWAGTHTEHMSQLIEEMRG